MMRQPTIAILVVLSTWLSCCWNRASAFQPTTTTTLTTRIVVVSKAAVQPPTSRRIPQRSSSSSTSSSNTQLDATAIVAGATGYIGKSVVREALRQGYTTIALVRDAKKSKALQADEYFKGAIVVECDVTNEQQLVETFRTIQKIHGDISAVISCLASRSGTKTDAYLIDYQATLNCLTAGRAVTTPGKAHFVLLSAYCVKNPTLQFQQAKLKFEAALTAQDDMSYTVVRPTAFFKSVSGQLEVVQSGAPFVMFGEGDISRCNPIAESDLATFLVDSISNETRRNKIINLGGPDDGFTMQQQGKMLFEITGMPEKYIKAPVWIFDAVINGLQFLADLSKLQALEDAAETGRIGKYYAVEDMWTTDPAEKYGTITLREHYERICKFGQEYDPYTTMFARAQRVDAKAIRETEQSVAK